mmetsp:Transcript_11205/g.35688  ORF Transcript_11205/g.35688 Transcript_11205/m.35688 type:complete len:269 (+) Transcript_11205:288-1094(+)
MSQPWSPNCLDGRRPGRLLQGSGGGDDGGGLGSGLGGDDGRYSGWSYDHSPRRGGDSGGGGCEGGSSRSLAQMRSLSWPQPVPAVQSFFSSSAEQRRASTAAQTASASAKLFRWWQASVLESTWMLDSVNGQLAPRLLKPASSLSEQQRTSCSSDGSAHLASSEHCPAFPHWSQAQTGDGGGGCGGGSGGGEGGGGEGGGDDTPGTLCGKVGGRGGGCSGSEGIGGEGTGGEGGEKSQGKGFVASHLVLVESLGTVQSLKVVFHLLCQ